VELWIKFGLMVFFGVWGFFAGLRLPRETRNLFTDFLVDVEMLAFVTSLVVLVTAALFWVAGVYGAQGSPVGVSFLVLPALAYLLATSCARAVRSRM